MEDLSVVLKRSLLQDLYKKRGDVFGTLEQRLAKMNEKRKSVRHDAAFIKRRIPENMSPIDSPLPVLKLEKTLKNTNRPVNKRLEMLEKWKADKQKRKEEQQKHIKPLFKVTHIPVEIGLPKLDTVNKEIKGKPIKSKFAPPNHKFKPPANVKPISLNVGKLENKGEERQMVTRSQARSLAKPNTKDNLKKKESTKSKKTTKQKDSAVKVTQSDVKESTKNDPNDSMSPDYPIVSKEEAKTPEKKEPPPVYVSPFVTISRGKESARKEYEARKFGKSFSFNKDIVENTSPKAGAKYFEWRLKKQISRLQELCDHWNKYKVEENPPEEAISVIDVAIGQTNLLLTKKFVQFKGLIDACLNGDVNAPVTCEDLHGFWDMIYIQVNNLDKRFEELHDRRTNNWQEVIPEVKKIVKKRGRAVKAVKPSESLKEAIQAARRRRKEQIEGNGEAVYCPQKKTPQNRTSVHMLVKSAEIKHRNSSPGLMMMKVAQYAKGVDTPAKSILKNDAQKSAKSQTKTVLFQDELTEDINDIENDLNNLNLQSKSKTPTRRSIRLSKSKLF